MKGECPGGGNKPLPEYPPSRFNESNPLLNGYPGNEPRTLEIIWKNRDCVLGGITITGLPVTGE